MCSAADLEDLGDIDSQGWLEAPWWLDAVDAADVLADADVLAPPPDGELFAPLSVAETLGVVELAGPGPEAIRLLASLSGRVLSDDQRLSRGAADAGAGGVGGRCGAAVDRGPGRPAPPPVPGGPRTRSGRRRWPRVLPAGAGTGVAHLGRSGQGAGSPGPGCCG